MRIAALCSGKIGIPAIQQIVQMGHQLQLAMPEGQQEEYWEIEQFAAHVGIPVLKLRKAQLVDDMLNWLLTQQAELLCIFTFPWILPKKLLDQLRFPIINFHYAPLPQYRGAQPLFWMIKNQEKQGGVTAHLLTSKVDAGPIVHFQPVHIQPNETYGMHNANAAMAGASCVLQVLSKLNQPNWKEQLIGQDEKKAAYWGSPQASDVTINWQQMTAMEIVALCKATNPWNKGAVTSFQGLPLKTISWEITTLPIPESVEGGTVIASNAKDGIVVACQDGKAIRLKIAYLEQGYFSGEDLLAWGIVKGMKFA